MKIVLSSLKTIIFKYQYQIPEALGRTDTLGELTEYIYHYINYYNNDRIVTRLKTSPIKYKNQLKNQRMCS